MQPWYPFYWSDYSGKTFNLTQGQHGAYILLLRHIYTTGEPIPDEQRYSIARAMLEQECQNVDFVLHTYFTENKGKWHHERADEVIAESHAKHEKRVNSGRKGGAAKSSNAVAMPEQSSSNALLTTTTTTLKKEKDKSFSKEAGFNAFWGAYPRKVGKGGARKSFERAKLKVDANDLIAAAERFAKRCQGKDPEFIPHPTTWLNQERWADEEPKKSKPPACHGGLEFEPPDRSKPWSPWGNY